MTNPRKFEVFDDFISPTYQRMIKDSLEHNNTSWVYQQNMDYGANDSHDPEQLDRELNDPTQHAQFLLGIFDSGNVGNEPFYYMLYGLIAKIKDELVPDLHPYRIRAVLQTPIPNPPDYYIPHTDNNEKGKVSLIYYPHDATGDTYLFQESWGAPSDSNRRQYHWNPIDSVTPKQGRLIMFPSDRFHAGSPPKYGRRMLINFNYG